MRVGERIQAKMKENRISQNRLAKMAQISQSGLSSIISGAVSPKEITLVASANALNCSVSELIGEDPTEPRENVPRTPEAKILAEGIDRLPKEQREQALEVMRAVFATHADYFMKKGDNSDDS